MSARKQRRNPAAARFTGPLPDGLGAGEVLMWTRSSNGKEGSWKFVEASGDWSGGEHAVELTFAGVDASGRVTDRICSLVFTEEDLAKLIGWLDVFVGQDDDEEVGP